MAPVPAANGPGRDRRADHGRPSRTARVARTARGRLQRAARRPAVPAVSAPRLRARGLAVAVPRRLVAPLAGALAGRRDRGGTSRDRRPLLRCDERADRVRRTGDWLAGGAALRVQTDRKSTRLNSSHGYISYAVFCLKKKKKSFYIGSMNLLTHSIYFQNTLSSEYSISRMYLYVDDHYLPHIVCYSIAHVLCTLDKLK